MQWSPRLPWDLGAAELVWAQPLPCVMRWGWLVGHPPHWDLWERPDGSGIQQRGGFVCKDNPLQTEIKPCGMKTSLKSHEGLGDEGSWARMFGQEGLSCPALAHPLCLVLVSLSSVFTICGDQLNLSAFLPASPPGHD